MAKKNSYKIKFDSPFSISFSVISFAIFILDLLTKGKLISSLFTCLGSKVSENPFNFKSAVCWLSVIFHEFGTSSWNSLFINLSFILLIGPALEIKYGIPVLSLMTFISSLVTGVLTATICPVPVTGCESIIFTLIILASLTEFTKKNIPLSWILIFVFFLSYQFISSEKAALNIKLLPVLIKLIGGITGSLFGFMVAPKKKSEPKKKAEATIVKEEPASSSSDETIIGSISL